MKRNLISFLVAKGDIEINPLVTTQPFSPSLDLSVNFEAVTTFAFQPFLPAIFPTEMEYLSLLVGKNCIPLFPGHALPNWTVLYVVGQPFPSFTAPIPSINCVLLSRPAFLRVEKCTFRQNVPGGTGHFCFNHFLSRWEKLHWDSPGTKSHSPIHVSNC